MKLPQKLFSGRGRFRSQLVLAFTIGIVFLALASSVVTSHLTSNTIRDRLIEQGLQATEGFAAQSKLALLYHSAENAEDAVQATLGFPDVRGLAIYDMERKALLARGELVAVLGESTKWPLELAMVLETGSDWHFAAPVYTDDLKSDEEHSIFEASPPKLDLIGYVHVVMGKQTLQAMAEGILKTNLVVSAALAGLLLLVLLWITTRLTRPLNQLANIMLRAEEGEKMVRAQLVGPMEVVDMTHAFNTMMDVLEGREQQLEKARDAALESARAKGEFAANVTHELRTPLSAVLGMLELLQRMGLTEKQRGYVEVALNAGESLLYLIDDILDFSRMESGKLKREPRAFQLRDVLGGIVELLGSQAQRKELDLGYVVADGVPNSLLGEPERIRQVLINLVGNAIKFTKQGEIAIEVHPDEERDSNLLLRFEVSDTGIGIQDDAQAQIFESFMQVDGSTTRKYGGAGLGLAISRQLTEFMGGEIGVKSESGRGSTFWFTVLVERHAEDAAERFTVDDDTLAELRVLVVDDSDITRRSLGQMLSTWQIRHDVIGSGLDAMTLLRDAAASEQGYNVAIVDMDMPFVSGSDLIRQIKGDPILSDISVILMLNQRELPSDRLLCANVLGHLTKPISESRLFELVTLANDGQQSESGTRSTKLKFFGSNDYAGSRVLVVEDDRGNQQVAIGMLGRLGCHIETAANGREALELISRQPRDLILMDCHMPGMDGYEATRQIRALERGDSHIPIIAMTANVGAGDQAKCMAAGMDDFLSKPLKMESLREKMQEWLHPGDAIDEGDGQTLAGDEATLDGELLAQMRESIGQAFPRMLEVYLEDMPIYLSSLERAIVGRDAQAIKELAHTVKGSGRNIGALRLVSLSQQLEELDGTVEGLADQLYKQLASEYENVKLALQHEFQPDERRSMTRTQDRHRIVVVEDDRGMRWALRNVLLEAGYRIDEVENGAQAVELCGQEMPDMLLMDGLMPVMDGFAACGLIRELPGGAEVPILIVTALDDEKSVERAFSVGATDFIPKPVHFAVLRQRVARLLDARRTEKHVRQLAYRDTLTGLPNRALFKERLEALLSKPTAKQVHAILFLDLDRFKIANDTLGHEVGDLLLKAVAERIQGCVREGDLVARLGGDEFTILLENIRSSVVAANAAEKIRSVISKPFSFMGRQVYVSGSMGISIYPDDGKDSGTLVKHADMAMFRAKEQRDTYKFFEIGMESSVSKRLELEIDLRRALEREELVLHYQPQVSLHTGKIVGMEALIRWQHPERGPILPRDFISVAEETGLIIPIGEWVLRTACAQHKAWQDSGLPKINVAVNVSPRQLADSDLVETVRAVLEETGLDPQCLELEITEGAVMTEPQKMGEKLQALKAVGASISIDDFGTGYSSLSYLKNFPFDTLKIDQSFIRNLPGDPDDAAITLTVITLAHSLKLHAIAEGVETEEQLRYLIRNGCDEIQGYYFSRPVPAKDAESLLREGRRLSLVDRDGDGGPTLLIVDDDPISVELLQQLLQAGNYRILTAGHPREGFEYLAMNDVQVVISDQVMPDMDGLEFLARVKGLYPEAVRIMLTAHPDLSVVTEAINEGLIHKFVTKPWDDDNLCAEVDKAFEQYDLERNSGFTPVQVATIGAVAS